MLAKVFSMGLMGIDGYRISVEVDVASSGIPIFEMVGLPDATVKESKERVRAALRNSGYDFPSSRLTINLAPADVRKEGSVYDLPIALGILRAHRQISCDVPEDMLVMGELSLDGKVRGIHGALPMVLSARDAGCSVAVLPRENAAEGSCVPGIRILAIDSLKQLVDMLEKRVPMTFEPAIRWEDCMSSEENAGEDMNLIKGQRSAKRALEVAAAGAHNVLMIGPPGSGKSMLARTLPGILPDLSFEESVEVTKLLSISGELPGGSALVCKRQVRAPHHTASPVSLVGGGQPVRPGDISLAHYGVLFLDELPEFKREVLEVLRQPLEDGRVLISRASGSYTFPSQFMLVAAMNPCPCGYFGSRVRQCTCSPSQISRYLGRISGPLIDRMDIQVEVGAVEYRQLTEKAQGESSGSIKKRVSDARAIQHGRYKKEGILSNAQMDAKALEKYCGLSDQCDKMMEEVFTTYGMSARARARILKVARTIADLAGGGDILPEHLAEAIQYRVLDRKYWGNIE